MEVSSGERFWEELGSTGSTRSLQTPWLVSGNYLHLLSDYINF